MGLRSARDIDNRVDYDRYIHGNCAQILEQRRNRHADNFRARLSSDYTLRLQSYRPPRACNCFDVRIYNHNNLRLHTRQKNSDFRTQKEIPRLVSLAQREVSQLLLQTFLTHIKYACVRHLNRIEKHSCL